MSAEVTRRLSESPAAPLPTGRHFALTWGLTDNFGGMTSALLHRSRAFVRLGGVSIDILTFDARTDYPELADRLRQRGDTIPGIRVLNLWDWLRENTLISETAGDKRTPTVFTPLRPDEPTSEAKRVGPDGAVIVLERTRLSSDGSTVLQTDHYRYDGTLLISDRRDCAVRGKLGVRTVVLCGSDGEPIHSFTGIWELYRRWLDELTAKQPSFMIVDSKTVANFMLGYHRSHVVTSHVVHSSHLASAAQLAASPSGFAVRPTRKAVFENLAGFDSIVLLTNRQRDDVRAQLSVPPARGPRQWLQGGHEDGAASKQSIALQNISVIPNSRDLGTTTEGASSRAPGRGIVLASLTARKRVDHAIRAAVSAAYAARSNAGSAPITLDVYGSGDEETTAALHTLITDLDATDIVTLHGHDPQARDQLGHASFLLATGTSEGFPLVLVESLAAGCIPLSYDIPYGPADVIDHGKTGFLVPPGDVTKLASTISKFVLLPENELTQMRDAARLTAKQFSDEKVTALWARELTAAAKRKSDSRVAPPRAMGVRSFGRKAIRRLLRLVHQ